MSLSRRNLLRLGLGAGASWILDPLAGLKLPQRGLIRKPIPSTGEELPVIGLGSWITFNLARDSADWAPAREVMRLFVELGGKVIDTAPAYQRSESFIGETVREFGLADRLFLATKVNVEGSGAHAAVTQMDDSSSTLGKHTIDLMQVWNLGDSFSSLTDRHLAAHLESVAHWKELGRTRYIGVTTSFNSQYEMVEKALGSHALDFIQVDLSIGDRAAEDRLLPAAMEKGVAVIVNRPFTGGGLFQRLEGRTLPPWAREFDCSSWAQFFLKYIVSHPAVTCAIPATNDPNHLRDNMGACVGPLPDAATRKRMVEYFTAL